MKNLRHLSPDALRELVHSLNEKPFRAQQIHEWLWHKGAASIDAMSNLSKSFRDRLKAEYDLMALQVHHAQYSDDGTIKNRFITHDGHFVEGVLIPTETRMTACVSSQVGCSLSCKFCATGYLDRKRNLDFDEIVDQVVLLNQQAEKHFGKRLPNIVFMGMGEPLLNYKSMMKAIEMITSPDGLGMSPTRITVSTAGIAKMIRQLADDNVRFNLALSLHAATDAQRNEIMPINESNRLSSLVEALNYFYTKTKNPITFEYILFDQFNDSEKDADHLIKICRKVPAKVNIIEYNPIGMAEYRKPSEENVQRFMDYLAKHRVNARLRRSRGKDIDAACGQLANVDTPTSPAL